MEVIPRTLAQNCGANVIRTLTKLRAKHAEEAAGGNASCSYGINGETGALGWGVKVGVGVGGFGRGGKGVGCLFVLGGLCVLAAALSAVSPSLKTTALRINDAPLKCCPK